MEFYIKAIQKSIFNKHSNLPILEFVWHSEESRYAMQGFERRYPELELIEIT